MHENSLRVTTQTLLGYLVLMLFDQKFYVLKNLCYNFCRPPENWLMTEG